MTRIVAFSHLRWDFVYQRPQHLLSRFAYRMPVTYIEEPVQTADATEAPWLETIDAAPGVTVLRVHANIAAPGFHDAHLSVMRSLLAPVLTAEAGAVAWFYTPMALPLLADLDASAIVYDCMDELTGFSQAPRQMAQREHALLQRADVVFTGGPSLYRAKQSLHPSVHCFPSSVDAAHFASARSRAAVPHPLQAHIPGPRLGYYGVIDERFDPTIVAALADADPTWQVILVGPVAKIDPASLPQRPNVHYLGLRTYAELPALLADWDVGLMPFAHNESTRFISPTKVLEYMAAGKPIVSTAIRDVVDPYAFVVAIADHPSDFVEACRAALGESAEAREARVRAMATFIDATSWDQTVDRMNALLVDAIGRRAAANDRSKHEPANDEVGLVEMEGDATADGHDARVIDASLRQATPTHVGCAVIGAGPTGLSTGYHLKSDVIVFERESKLGGWCRSINDHGFTFDYAGHIMFSNNPIVHEMYRVLLGDNVHWQNREAWVYSHGVHTRYPFQGALHGLPPEVLKECLVGAIEARFGSIDGTEDTARARARPADAVATNSAPITVPAGDPKDATDDDCCGDGELTRPAAACAPGAGATTAASTVVSLPVSNAPSNFEEFIYRTWGAGVAKHFAIPYNKKLWTVPLADIETSWLGGRVPLPDLAEMIEGAVQPAKKPVGPNARFGYPLRGGFQALMDGFLPHLEGRLELDADVVALDVKRHRFALGDGRCYSYDKLVSTMPLPRLIALIGDAAPQSVRTAAAGLRHVSVRCVNLGVARENITEKHWIYYPGETVFHRVFVQGNASPYCNPPGGFGLTCEISHAPNKPLPCDGEELIERCFDDCVSVGLLNEDDRLITANQVDMGYAYVIYDHARAANVGVIRDWLTHFDIILAGRYSEWEYYNSDHAFLAGHKAATQVRPEMLERVSGAA